MLRKKFQSKNDESYSRMKIYEARQNIALCVARSTQKNMPYL